MARIGVPRLPCSVIGSSTAISRLVLIERRVWFHVYTESPCMVHVRIRSWGMRIPKNSQGTGHFLVLCGISSEKNSIDTQKLRRVTKSGGRSRNS